MNPCGRLAPDKTATPNDAQDMHRAIRHYLTEHLGQDTAEQVRVLYGGSVKPDNALALASEADVDGALVGGASLNAADFLAIVRATLQAG
jgi:triosephosphate isomerase